MHCTTMKTCTLPSVRVAKYCDQLLCVSIIYLYFYIFKLCCGWVLWSLLSVIALLLICCFWLVISGVFGCSCLMSSSIMRNTLYHSFDDLLKSPCSSTSLLMELVTICSFHHLSFTHSFVAFFLKSYVIEFSRLHCVVCNLPSALFR